MASPGAVSSETPAAWAMPATATVAAAAARPAARPARQIGFAGAGWSAPGGGGGGGAGGQACPPDRLGGDGLLGPGGGGGGGEGGGHRGSFVVSGRFVP